MIRINDRVRVSNKKKHTYNKQGVVKSIDGDIANVYVNYGGVDSTFKKHIKIRLDNLEKV